MNIIFLDFDGVIYTNYYKSDEQIEEKIKILSDICNKFDCKVVIEASAKDAIDETTLEIDEESLWIIKIFELFKKYNIECIGRTPNARKINSNHSYLPMWKEDEIRLYLLRHPEVEHYCIIDDDDLSSMHRRSDLDKVRNHLVKTKDFLLDNKEDEGLQSYHIEEVEKVLQLENDIKRYIIRKNKKR